MIPPEVGAALSTAAGRPVQVALLLGVLWLLRLLLQGVLLHRRQRQALQLAPAVYAAGGDPAAVLRAASPDTQQLAPAETPAA